MSREKIVEESLGLKDKIQKSYAGDLDGVYGIIFMSTRKIIFITEKGFFRKSYDLVLDLPYEKIKSLRTEGKRNLIIETEDLKHTFEFPALRISSVEETLRELMPSQDARASRNEDDDEEESRRMDEEERRRMDDDMMMWDEAFRRGK